MAAIKKDSLPSAGIITEKTPSGWSKRAADPANLSKSRISVCLRKVSDIGMLFVKYSKTAINKGIQTDIDTGLEIEKNLFALCFASQDQKEGMTAFLEKRKPNFK